REQLGDDRVQLGFDLIGRLQPSLAAALAQPRDEELGRLDAGVGREQRSLELLEQRFVDLARAEQARKARACVREPVLQPREPGALLVRLLEKAQHGRNSGKTAKIALHSITAGR